MCYFFFQLHKLPVNSKLKKKKGQMFPRLIEDMAANRKCYNG